MGLLLVVAGLLPGVGGDLIELCDLVGGERPHGVVVGAALGDVVRAEGDRHVRGGVAEDVRVGRELVVGGAQRLDRRTERVQADGGVGVVL